MAIFISGASYYYHTLSPILITDDSLFNVWLNTPELSSTVRFTITYSDHATESHDYIIYNSDGVVDLNLIPYTYKLYHVTGIIFEFVDYPYFIDDISLIDYGYPMDTMVVKQDISKTYDIGSIFKHLNITNSYLIDVMFENKRTYDIDEIIIQLDIPKPYLIDVAFASIRNYDIDNLIQRLNITKSCSFDLLIKYLNLTKTEDIDVKIVKVLTDSYLTDVIQKKLDIVKPKLIDVVFKQLNLTKTFSIDELIVKLGLTYTDLVDTLLIKLGIEPRYVDVLLQKNNLSLTDDIDIVLVKDDVHRYYDINVVLKKLGLTINNSVDMLIKKLGLTRDNTIDLIIKKLGEMKTYDVDTIFKYLNITRSYDVDVSLIKNLTIQNYSIDAIIKALEAVKSYSGGRIEKFIIDMRVICIDVISPLLVEASGTIGNLTNNLTYDGYDTIDAECPIQFEVIDNLPIQSSLIYGSTVKPIKLSNCLSYDNEAEYLTVESPIRDIIKIGKIKKLRTITDILDL